MKAYERSAPLMDVTFHQYTQMLGILLNYTMIRVRLVIVQRISNV